MWDAPNAVVVFGAAKAIRRAEQKNEPSGAVHDDGGIYDGEWLDKKKHGHGCYKYSSGSTYEGQWRNNVKEGLGVCTRRQGRLVRGRVQARNVRGHGHSVFAKER